MGDRRSRSPRLAAKRLAAALLVEGALDELPCIGVEAGTVEAPGSLVVLGDDRQGGSGVIADSCQQANRVLMPLAFVQDSDTQRYGGLAVAGNLPVGLGCPDALFGRRPVGHFLKRGHRCLGIGTDAEQS